MSGKLLLCAALMLCSGFAGSHVRAQDTGVLSKEPFILRIFNREDNESVTIAGLIERNYSDFPSSPMWPKESPRVNLFFINALYTFPGKAPVRPQSVSFIIAPRKKPKEPVSFSVTADGEIVHQGEIVPGQGEASVDRLKADKREITVPVPTEVFLRLAQAKKVEFKIGKTSEKLNSYKRKAITALAVTINAIGK